MKIQSSIRSKLSWIKLYTKDKGKQCEHPI